MQRISGEAGQPIFTSCTSVREHFCLVPTLPWLPLIQQDLLERLLNRDPSKRLSARRVLDHPWLREGGAPTTTIEPEVLVRLRNYATNHKLKRAALKVKVPQGGTWVTYW